MLKHRQSIGTGATGRSYEFDYTYTVSGALQQMKYPARGSSRTIVTYQFDATGAQTGTGRLTGALREDTGSTQKYADSLQYWAGGALKSMALGNTTTETTEIDGRGRMKSRQLLSGASNIVKLEFGYSAGGNVTQQTRTQGSTGMVTTYPSYDGVNRLKQVNEAGWSSARTYDYDRWGNIWMSGGPVGLHSATAKSAAYYNTATNRLVKRGPLGDPPNGPIDLPSGAYDAAGNLVSHLDLGVFQYDAEGRITQATAGSPTITTTYEYDGDGRRVRKIVAGGGTTVFVYDAFGQLALDEGPGTVTPETVYLTADHLGSTRYRRGASETGEKCYDYFPFGEALTTSRPGCFAADGAPAASVGGEWMRVRFTGQWRDWETSLDHFVARYYSAAVGRFTSPDPLQEGSSNRYAYSANNPLRFIDPTGLKEIPVEDCQSNQDCILLTVTIVLDKTARIYGADGRLLKRYQESLDAQIAQARDEYGSLGIALDVKQVSGKVKNEKNGHRISEGYVRGTINVGITDMDNFGTNAHAADGRLAGGDPFIYIAMDNAETHSGTLSHEVAHFAGGEQLSRLVGLTNVVSFGALNAVLDIGNDLRRSVLRGQEAYSNVGYFGPMVKHTGVWQEHPWRVNARRISQSGR